MAVRSSSGDLLVAVAGQEHLQAQVVGEGGAQASRDAEGDVFLEESSLALGTEVAAPVPGVDDDRAYPRRIQGGRPGCLSGSGRARGGRARGGSNGLEVEDEARRLLLLESLDLLETLAEGDDEHVLATAHELDLLHDAARHPLLLEDGIHHVTGHRHRDPSLLLVDAEGHLFAGVEDHTRSVAGEEGAHRHPRDARVAEEHHARRGPPLDLDPEEGLEEPRQRVDGDEPLSMVVDDGRREQAQVAPHRGEAFPLVDGDFSFLEAEGGRGAAGVARQAHPEARHDLVDGHELHLTASLHGRDLAALTFSEDHDRGGCRRDERSRPREQGGSDQAA